MDHRLKDFRVLLDFVVIVTSKEKGVGWLTFAADGGVDCSHQRIL